MLTGRIVAGPVHPSFFFFVPATPHWLPAWLQMSKSIFSFPQDTPTGCATSTAPGCLWTPGTRRGATTASACASCSPAMEKAGLVRYRMRPVVNRPLPWGSPAHRLVVRPSVDGEPGDHLPVTVRSERSQTVAVDGSAAAAAYQRVWVVGWKSRLSSRCVCFDPEELSPSSAT